MTQPMTDTRSFRKLSLAWLTAALAVLLIPSALYASGEEKAQKVTHTRAPAAPRGQPGDTVEEQWAYVDKQNAGCVSCHTKSDHRTMHASPAVVLSCADCHGGNTKVMADRSWNRNSIDYVAAMKDAHVLPKYPAAWGWPSSANPKRSYALLGKESPEFIRFVNPSDYRVARDSCGACHMQIIEASERSVLWRDYVQDWLVASAAIAGCLFGGYLLALFAGGAAPILAIVPQILASMLLFPAVARLCARLDVWRLK